MARKPDQRRLLEALKAEGIIKQREDDLFTVRLRMVGGRLEARFLSVLGELAERYGSGHVHLTSRQGVEIPNVRLGDLDAVRSALAHAGLELAAPGNRVRNIVACPGASCKNSLIDSQPIAQRLDEHVGRRDGLPHKCKIAIAGCPNRCGNTLSNDIGIMGVARGECALFVGGKMGKRPRQADRLPFTVADDGDLCRTVAAIVDWYAAHGETRERLAAVLDRIGLEPLLDAVGPPA